MFWSVVVGAVATALAGYYTFESSLLTAVRLGIRCLARSTGSSRSRFLGLRVASWCELA